MTGQSDSQSQSNSITDGSGRGHTRSRARTWSDTKGETDSFAAGKTRSVSDATGGSEGYSNAESFGNADAEGGSVGMSYNEAWRARHKITEKFSGKLVKSVQDQLYAIMNDMASLPDRMVLVKCKGMQSPFLLRVHEVRDAYEEKRIREKKRVPYSPSWRASDLRVLFERIQAAHGFYFVPQADAERVALDQFLAAVPDDKDAAIAGSGDRSRMNLGAPSGQKNPFHQPKKGP